MDEHSRILKKVRHKHASENTKYHVLYGYYHSTISNWIREYETHQTFRNENDGSNRWRKFGEVEIEWIRQLYINNPSVYFDETQALFKENFNQEISAASISRILEKIGFSRKVLEKRAIQIKTSEIDFYCRELDTLQWNTYNIVFSDEVGFDNRDMIRERGYEPIGDRILNHGNHVKQTRISLLCFMGIDGLMETFVTDGTFTRLKFFEACREFALGGQVKQYPGRNSIWILDGARIHMDPNLVRYFRSLGILIVFLPGYCPHMNPIEILFGLVKQSFKRDYSMRRTGNLKVFVLETLMKFKNLDAKNLFRKCGYYSGGKFNPRVN